jgi:hypothetical protein
MAAQPHGRSTEFDLKPHEQTWGGFLKLMWYTAAAAAGVLALMAYFLT